MIAWMISYTRLHRSTIPTSHCGTVIVWRHVTVAPSTMVVFYTVGRRATSFFGPGRARATTAAEPMTYCGRPRFCCHVSIFCPVAIQRWHTIRSSITLSKSVEHSYSLTTVASTIICPRDWAFFRSERWTLCKGTVIGSFRGHISSVRHLRKSDGRFWAVEFYTFPDDPTANHGAEIPSLVVLTQSQIAAYTTAIGGWWVWYGPAPCFATNSDNTIAIWWKFSIYSAQKN